MRKLPDLLRLPVGALLGMLVVAAGAVAQPTPWESIGPNVGGKVISALRVAPSAPAALYAAVQNTAVFKTKAAHSGTVTWSQLPVFYSCINIEDIAISASDSAKLYSFEGGT